MIQLQNPLLRFPKTTKGNFSGEDFHINPTVSFLDDSDCLAQIMPYKYQAKLPMIQRWNEILCKMLFANLEGLLGKPLSAPYLWNKFFWILVDLIHALGDDDLVLFPFLPLPIGTGHLSNDRSHCHGVSISDTKKGFEEKLSPGFTNHRMMTGPRIFSRQ